MAQDENERGRGANARMRFRGKARGQERENVRKASRSMRLLIAVDAVLFLAILIAGGMLLYRRQNREAEQHLSEIQAPDWYTQDFLTINPYSRPGTKREHVRDIVIHYVLTREPVRYRTGIILRAERPEWLKNGVCQQPLHHWGGWHNSAVHSVR